MNEQSNIVSDHRYMGEVLVEKRIEIFGQVINPVMTELGLTNWNGKYIWYSNFNDEGTRHVVEYNVLAFYRGSFSYGNCFNSVPTISSGKK